MGGKGYSGDGQNQGNSVFEGSPSLSARKPLLNIDFIKEEEKRKNHFAAGMNGYKIFWFFMFSCAFGVLIETVFWYLRTQQIESRVSFVLGPLNLVYGLGGIFLTVILYHIHDKPFIIIALAGAVIGCTVEYLCSFFQEHLLGSISWHYSDHFDIGGRTNLKYAFFWGVLAVFWIRIMYPVLSRAILHVPERAGIVLTWMMVVFMVINLGLTLISVQRWRERMMVTEPQNAIDKLMDKWYPDETMKELFPNMRYLSEDTSSEN